MKRKIIRSLWLIPFIIGICLGISGIVSLNQAKNIYVPEMGEDGWFDAETKQSQAEFGGIIKITVGFGFFAFMGSLIVGVVTKHLTTTPEEVASETAKEIDIERRYTKKLKELTGDYFDTDVLDEQTTPEINYCEYCGSIVPAKSTTCESCGAKVKIKNNKK